MKIPDHLQGPVLAAGVGFAVVAVATMIRLLGWLT